MTTRLSLSGGPPRLQGPRGTAPRPSPWAAPAEPYDAVVLACLLFGEGAASADPEDRSILDLTVSLLISWRFRVDVAEPALDGVLSPDPDPLALELTRWVEAVFGPALDPAKGRLAKLAQLVEVRCISERLAAADLPWSAAALADALRLAAGTQDILPAPGPITRLRLAARGVEVLRGVDIGPGDRAGEARLVSDDAWVEFRIEPGVTAASPVCRIDVGVRLQTADPMATLYLSYENAKSEEKVALTPRGRMRYAAYVAVAGLRTIRWKPDDAAGGAVFTLLTARPAQLAALQDLLPGPARTTSARLIRSLQESGAMAESALEALQLSRLLTRELGAHEHAGRSYAAWIRRHELQGAEADRVGRSALIRLIDLPRVSLMVRLRHHFSEGLDATVQSLIAQLYPDWELHLLASAPLDDHLRERLQACTCRDGRIRLTLVQDEAQAAPNTVAPELTGDWVGVLAPGDVLARHALLRIVDLVSTRPHLRLVYSDADAMDAAGQRFDPVMKPDMSPELLLGCDYLGPLVLQRTDEVRAVGGWRPALGEAQDYDLTLRLLERTGAAAAAHIPEVLCHRVRRDAGSPCVAPSAEPRAQVVAAHLARTGRPAQVEPLPSGGLRLRNALPEPSPLVSLIIPTRDRADLLAKCVGSILDRSTYPAFEIVIVDNGSREAATHQLFAELQRDGRVRVLKDGGDFNFSRLNNFAAGFCRGDVLALVNNDIEVISPDWIEEMTGWTLQPGVGCVGGLLRYPSGRVQHAGVVLGLGGVAEHVFKLAAPEVLREHWRLGVVHEVSAVTGACLFVRKALYKAMGGLDETLKVSFNDVDLCLRVRQAGHRNLLTPFAELYHHESVSRGSELSGENAGRFEAEIRLMYERWGPELAADPFYSPNLTRTAADYGLRWLDK